MHFVIWQLVAATERAGARRGTEHPTPPHITHTPPPPHPQPSSPAYPSLRLRSHVVKVTLNCRDDRYWLYSW